MRKDITFTVATLPDREREVVEIFVADTQFAELSYENDRLRVEIYGNPQGNSWDFGFRELCEVLEAARLRLADAIGGIPERLC